MSSTTDATLTRVTSADGTPIAVFVSGRGRPLVIVHGTTSDHTTWRLVLPLLEPHLAVHAMDRRGRGDSGDSGTYALELEYADVAAVVDAAAGACGGPVDLLGHSYGGNIAFGMAADNPNIRRLLLYEGWPPPNIAHRTTSPELMARVESRLAEGRNEQALEAFFRDMVHMSEEEISALTATPSWPARVAAAHTIPRELRAFGRQGFDAAQAARISMPVLLLVGSESTDAIKADPEVVAAALPQASIRVLEGQTHVAQLTAPQMLADAITSFLAD